MLLFELRVALRYFRSGGMQSALTVMGVAVGVVLFIFISSLIGGLQKGLVQQTIGSISQVTIEPNDRDPKTLSQLEAIPKGQLAITRVEKFGAHEAKLDDWQTLISVLDREPGIIGVSPTVSGPGFAIRGNQIKPITLRGIDPIRNQRIIDLPQKMVSGAYNISNQNCVIGIQLAADLGVRVKDKVRIRSDKNRELTFTVSGIFDAGIKEINQRSFYISLTNGQRLLNLVGYLTSVDMKIADVFQANDVCDRLGLKTGLKTKSWMRENRELLSGLSAQSNANVMIKTFVMISVAFGIASVLIVTVVQKSREIGILKSMGARTRSITMIFLLQGLLVGIIGSVIGCLLGSALVYAILQIPGSNQINKGHLFPAELEMAYIWQAISVSVIMGTLAGVAPARRAARMDPVEVIRYG